VGSLARRAGYNLAINNLVSNRLPGGVVEKIAIDSCYKQSV
jgi:hypothetical protein